MLELELMNGIGRSGIKAIRGTAYVFFYEQFNAIFDYTHKHATIMEIDISSNLQISFSYLKIEKGIIRIKVGTQYP